VRLLGLLLLAHVPCLALADRPPYRGLVWLPLVGRALLAGVWLWLLAADRVPADRADLLGLLAHDAVWPPGLLWCAWSRHPETV
jgi:hypothetical protein